MIFMISAIAPPGGSVCRMLNLPPDDTFRGKVGEKEVRAWFAAVGAPAASTYSARAAHPYMQKTATLDLCMVVEGEATLVLDTQEVRLKQSDTVVLRGSNHAWANRGTQNCTIAFVLIDAKEL